MPERHPGWVDGIDAAEARLATGLLAWPAGTADQLDPLRARTGLRDAAGFPGLVTAGTNKVTVNPFQAVIADSARPDAGSYLVTLDAAKDLPVQPADQSNSRIDLVIAAVDPASPPGVQVQLVTGRPAPAPQPQALPVPTSLLLAQLTVPAVGGGAPTVQDRRQFTAAMGGILPVFGPADLPATASSSAFAYRLDTGTLLVHKGGQWVTYSPPPTSVDTWHNAALVNGWTNRGGGFAPAAYTRTADGWVRLQGLVSGGDITKTIFTLPTGYRPVANHVFAVKVAQGTVGPLNVTFAGLVQAGVPGDGAISTVWTSLEGVAFATY